MLQETSLYCSVSAQLQERTLQENGWAYANYFRFCMRDIKQPCHHTWCNNFALWILC